MPSDQTHPLRVGLIGYGLAGRVFHAPLIAATPDLQLSAVVTRDPERRATLQAEHPGAAALDTPDELWARVHELDVVVVATPNRTHVPLARAALQAGLHARSRLRHAPAASCSPCSRTAAGMAIS